MKRKLLLTISMSLLILFPAAFINAQSVEIKPAKIIKPVHFDISKNLRDVEPIPPGTRSRSWKNNTIKNKSGFLQDFQNPAIWDGRDPVLQDLKPSSRDNATVDQNFAGVGNLSGVAPPDTDGDVGPNHYFQMINLSFAIWDKTGTQLIAPADNQTIWEGFDDGMPYDNANDGDPIVLYDEYADRWLVSQFAVNTSNNKFYELVAISTSPDPTGSYYRYAFEFDNMPDYPKFGIWPDGYYLSVNQFANGRTWAGGGVAILDRSAMIAGNSSASMVFFNLGTSYGSLLPADCDGSTLPPSGEPNTLLELTTSSLRVWQASVDWNNPGNSTVTSSGTLPVQSFSYSGISISQPGTSQKLDALSDRLMYRAQYRNFTTHQSMVTNHTVNAGSGRAGVRWYELRNTGSGWSIEQQGTYAPADGENRWMASVAMNGSGEIAVGYSVSSSSTYPSIRVAGQTAGGSAGVLDVSETSIKEGANSQTGVNRWGDYSMMSVDPSDDNTFWFTTEYSSGGWNWKTQIASFNFSPYVPVAPVADFGASTTNPATGQTVNFTDLSENVPTSWSWTFAGGSPSTSTLENPSVTYNTPGTYDVSLTVTNSAGTDSKTVTGYITVEDNPITYCTSQGNNSSYEWISNVQIGAFTNSSGASGYTDFTGLTASLSANQNVAVSLTPDFSSTVYTEHWKVYIDYNHDGDFTDSGEEVFYQVGNSTVSGNFTVPSDASGTTRMRVSMKWNAEQTSCETFAYGEVEDYTVSFGDPPPPPPAPPVADFTADNTTVNEGDAVQFTDASSENPTSWSWTFSGGTPGSSTAENPSVTYNTAGTYDVSLTVTNADGSDTETKTGYITVNTVGGGGDPVEISFSDFDSGWGNWTDGGSDCRLYNGSSYAWSGTRSANIQDNSGVASSFYTTNGIDVNTPGYVQLEVEFFFISVSMENNEDFWVQYYDGSSWSTVADFNQGTDFQNNVWYVATVVISESSYTFPSNMKLRFMCDASNNADDVYIDDVTVTGLMTATNAPGKLADLKSTGQTVNPSTEEEFAIYPNPATNELNIILEDGEQIDAQIFSSSGQMLLNSKLKDANQTIDISTLDPGIYILRITADDETFTQKFIKR